MGFPIFQIPDSWLSILTGRNEDIEEGIGEAKLIIKKKPRWNLRCFACGQFMPRKGVHLVWSIRHYHLKKECLDKFAKDAEGKVDFFLGDNDYRSSHQAAIVGGI